MPVDCGYKVHCFNPKRHPIKEHLRRCNKVQLDFSAQNITTQIGKHLKVVVVIILVFFLSRLLFARSFLRQLQGKAQWVILPLTILTFSMDPVHQKVSVMEVYTPTQRIQLIKCTLCDIPGHVSQKRFIVKKWTSFWSLNALWITPNSLNTMPEPLSLLKDGPYCSQICYKYLWQHEVTGMPGYMCLYMSVCFLGFCDFEMDLCGWLNRPHNSSSLDWDWTSAGTAGGTFRPEVDHTTNSALGRSPPTLSHIIARGWTDRDNCIGIIMFTLFTKYQISHNLWTTEHWHCHCQFPSIFWHCFCQFSFIFHLDSWIPWQ